MFMRLSWSRFPNFYQYKSRHGIEWYITNWSAKRPCCTNYCRILFQFYRTHSDNMERRGRSRQIPRVRKFCNFSVFQNQYPESPEIKIPKGYFMHDQEIFYIVFCHWNKYIELFWFFFLKLRIRSCEPLYPPLNVV